ncbi:sensor histidine kinase [Plantactinospora sp. CA-290183]|uniref:sensor histidine kinase n=1 Tax=Plantactinospora sp. CA-290183 TaxID=3240006 RepID=UPI003D8C69C3
MPRRHALALLRNLAQFGLGLVGLAAGLFLLLAATVVLPYLPAARVVKRLAELGRRLAGDWGGLPVAVEHRPGPPAPQRRADGWYVYENQLYRSRRTPAYLLEVQWRADDPALLRELLWLLLTPVAGGVAVAVPPALVAGGVGLVAAGLAGGAPTALTGLVGLVLAASGVALGPAALRLHARWSRMLLRQPAPSAWWHRWGLAGWIGRRTSAAWHAAGLTGLGLAAFGGFLLNLLTALVTWTGLSPQVSALTRPLVARHRRYLGRWTGAAVAEPYRPRPAAPPPEEDGRYRVGRNLHPDRESAMRAQAYGWFFTDPATWRDQLWMLTNPLPGALGLVPAALISVGFFGLAWQPLSWVPWAVPLGLLTGEWVTPWYLWYGVTHLVPALDVVPGWVSLPLGLAVAALGALLGPPLLRLRGRYDRLLLSPTRSALLAGRVRRLTETRTDALDAQAAELRRIERDLHDGAQARLIAVGLSLAGVERLIEEDPTSARALVAQARETSATALTELRDLVRGIHPPVLAERGLLDAVRAVALDSPVPVEVTGELSGRLDPPVESAAYFSVLEALANAIRHAGAARIDVHVGRIGAALRITVTDDGRGGADPDRGTGLRGIRRRLAAFDGVLDLDSPPGGPTVLAVRIPLPAADG